MIKYFSKAFKITNENIILTTPLVFFLFLLSLYLEIAKNAPSNFMSSVLLIITILLMLAAFFAGWLYMTKQTIELAKKVFVIDEDKTKASFDLLKHIPIGIGEYFLPFIGAIILYGLFTALVFFISYKFGIHFIGKLNLNITQLKTAMESPVAMKALISSLSTNELIKVNYWNFLFIATLSFFSFITIFWAPEIIYYTKNPIVAFAKTLYFTFKNFLSAIVLFVYISFINFVVSIINAFSTINVLLYFVSMLIYFYFVVYIVVLIFLYYDQEHQPKEQIKQAENYCNSGTDSNGQESPCDSNSEGN